MKELFKNYKIPIILGSCALIAVILTVILLTGGFSSAYGLYVSSAYGTVSVTNSDNVTASTAGYQLAEGDIITVGSNSSCTLAYKGGKNSENNYIVLGPDSQIVVMNNFDGKKDGELFLRNGTAIANFAEKDHSPVIFRTADSSITTADSVAKIAYYTNEFMSYTDLHTFMGSSQIQLYDQLGNPVNNAEMQIEKKWGRVVSESGPSFEALNLDIDLNELTAFDLKTLITIANIVGEKFPYTPAELKAVYDTKADDSSGISIEEQTETVTSPVSESVDTSDTIQTAEPIGTTNPPPTETTLPGQTTTRPKTSQGSTTQVSTAPASTSNVTTSSFTTTDTLTDSETPSTVYHFVTIIIDGEETIQEVPHGGNAEKPADPQIDGLTFIGWDNSFENITEDRIITAMFDETFVTDNDSNNDNTNIDIELVHTVTVVIGDKTTVIQVAHGQSANLPATINVEGYIFKGWDKDYSSITEDITITAILEKNVFKVTFVIESDTFVVDVNYGDTAYPPYIPTYDSKGNAFTGWDKNVGNITADVTITALFADDNYHTVTFVIDGQFYNVKVKHGETAVPPFQPVTNAAGHTFMFWDTSLENITGDIMITAYYG